jgi:hypothetical protein
METSDRERKVCEIVTSTVRDFYVFCPGGEGNVKDLEDFVINNLRSRFGFKKTTAMQFFKPVFWRLCCAGVDNWDVVYEQKIYKKDREQVIYPSWKQRGESEFVEDIIERYSRTLNARLENAEYRGVYLD